MAWRALQREGVGGIAPPPPRRRAPARSGPDGSARQSWAVTAARPVLTLVLGQTPDPLLPDISSLVISGSIALDLTAKPPAGSGPFVTDALAELRLGGATLATASAAGATLRFRLATTLSPERALETLETLDAMDERSGRLAVRIRSATPGFEPIEIGLSDLVAASDDARRTLILVRAPDGTLSPAPVRHVARAGPGADRDATAAMPMVVTANAIVGLQLAMSPGSHASSAAALAATSAVQMVHLSPAVSAFIGADLVLASDVGEPAYRSAPVIDDASASLWSDAAGGAGWYAPDLAVVRPAPTDQPETAAFRFILSSTGPVLGGGTASQGLEAEIAFTLRATPPAGADSAARAVARDGLSCALELSYRQAGGTAVLTQRFPADVVDTGETISATVRLLDDWVRLAYAALSHSEDAQDTLPAARLVTTYSFFGYGRVPLVHVIGGGKLLQIAEAARRADLPAVVSGPTLVASERQLVMPHATLSFDREVVGRGPPPAGKRAIPLAALAIRPQIQIVRPPVTIVQPIPRPRLAGRTYGRQIGTDLTFPCALLGSFYCERDAQGDLHAFGCRDALRLGESSGKAFEEIVELRDPAYRVWRSLQQPGRFMVVPASYRVGRYEPGDPTRAFRPIMLFSGELGSDPSQDSYQLSATLIADVSAARLALLQTRLADNFIPANVPVVLLLPTDPFVGATISVAWAMPQEVAAPVTLPVLDSFIVTVTLTPTAALLLTAQIDRSGISGGVTFALPDGTNLSSALSLDGLVIGPPSTGPVTATVGHDGATLVNRTASSLNVVGLTLIDGSGRATAVPAGLALDPGASTTIAIADATGATSCLVEARPGGPMPIEELDLFVEDVTQTVHFINQLAFANHGLRALALDARIKGSEHVESRDLPEGASLAIDFTLPITAYLGPQAIEFRLVETPVSGAPTTTSWREQPLGASSVIGITADLL